MRSPTPTVLTTRLTYLNRRHQNPFRGLIDLINVLNDLRKKSSSDPVVLFVLVWMASLSPALVGDLVDLDVSSFAIAYNFIR